jgi:hypothetical protein
MPGMMETVLDIGLKYGMPGLAQQAVLTNIELYGTQVIPRVRELLT